MAYKNNTETFYKEIINKVCSKVKEDFHNEGIGEDVLQEMNKVKDFFKIEVWNDKLMHLGIFQRISFMIHPGMGDSYSGLSTRYPLDRPMVHNINTSHIAANRILKLK